MRKTASRTDRHRLAHGCLRPRKYIPFHESCDVYLSLGGGYRLAYELYDQVDSGISEICPQDALQHRIAVHPDLEMNPRLDTTLLC